MKWYEENGKHLGFDDDTYIYRVAEDENGWYYEHVMTQDGFDGYETAEEAKAAAEADYKADLVSISQAFEEEELLTWEDLEDIHWDEIAHERMEIAKGLF